MHRLPRAIALFLIFVCLDAGLYAWLIRPQILSWGATRQQAAAAMPGDELAPYTSSTRAIEINAPREVVWQWLVQLGADRGGFYSYTFLENLLGYENGNVIDIVPEFQDMPVGRVVPSTPAGPDAPQKMSWTVAAVEPGHWLVLKNWGSFVLGDAGPGRTLLIVRTHGWDTPGLLDKAVYFVTMPLHYIMERRMLMGIKARAEAGPGVALSALGDYLWVGGCLFSLLAILGLVMLSRSAVRSVLGLGLGAAWLWVVLIWPVEPLYPLALLAAAALAGLPFGRAAKK